MNILINLIPIKKGGGQQVASNFIIQLLSYRNIIPVYLVTKGSYIHKKLIELEEKKIYTVENSLKDRLFFQSHKLKEIIKKHNIDLIYTLFGPGLHYKNIISVTGCAYSNLFFPEIDFWNGYPFLTKLKLKLIDRYRLKSTLGSNGIIFENKAMMERVISLFKYPANKVKLILPSISEYPKFTISESLKKRLVRINNINFNILMLTGWHKNKKIDIIPSILYELKQKGINDVRFIITISEDHPECKKVYQEAIKLKVEENICFFDTIDPHEVPILFDHINAVILLSLLESFSNNIIEAWYFHKMLFISDEEWSRSICEEAAIYVKRNDPKDIANKIIKYKSDKVFQNQMLLESTEVLKQYPDPQEKIRLQIDFLKNIYEL